jgi:hypothetical protein
MHYTITLDRQLTLYFAPGVTAEEAQRVARIARRNGHRNVTVSERKEAPEQGGATADRMAELVRL